MLSLQKRELEVVPREESAPNAFHPSAEVLQRFILGDVAKTEAMAIVRHLLRRCSVCTAIIQKGT
jgi:hypothetical protein